MPSGIIYTDNRNFRLDNQGVSVHSSNTSSCKVC
jgi:hypothetical protein